MGSKIWAGCGNAGDAGYRRDLIARRGKWDFCEMCEIFFGFVNAGWI